MPDDDLTERLLEAFVYVPIGFALEAKDLLPKLAARGRGQVALTRLAGTVAAQQGQNQAAKLVDEVKAAVDVVLGTEPAGDEPEAAPAEPPDDLDLPIIGYADLTAVEIVPLLTHLDDDELAAIEAYELSHRNRRTVLGRIAQRRR